jgi:hypothetical protein
VNPTVASASKALDVPVKTPVLPATPLSPSALIVSVKAPSVPAVSVQVTAPAVSVKASPSGVSATAPAVSVQATAPAVSVSATVPPVTVKASAPAVSVKATAPGVSVKATAPPVSAKVSTPAVNVKTTGTSSSAVTTTAPGVSVKTSNGSRSGGPSVIPAVTVGRSGASSASGTGLPPSGASSRRAVAGSATAGAGHNGPVASASAAMLADDGAATLDGGLATGFGQQAFTGYANSSGGSSPRAAVGAAARQRLLEREARDIVQRFAGCLATLTRRERLLLELLVGVDVPRALSRDQVARALHIRRASVPRLERIAITRLGVLARTTACASAARSAPTMELARYTALAAPGGVEAASGGVKAARYAKAPSGGASSKRASGHSVLGSIPASDTDTLWLLLAILLAALVIAALSVDAVGAGPRNRRWRAQWMAGPRRAWRRRRRR